jgi:hypothetical protein
MVQSARSQEAEVKFGKLTPFTPAALAGLVGLSFIGGEAIILLGGDDWNQQIRQWLRSVGELIRQHEDG